MPLAVTFYSLTAVWSSITICNLLQMCIVGEQLPAMLGFFVTTSSTALKSPPNTLSVALQKYLHTRIEKPPLNVLSEGYSSHIVYWLIIKH